MCSHPGNPNEYTIYHFQYKKENHPELFQICSFVGFFKRLKNELETAMVNEQSVLEPLKFYCTSLFIGLHHKSTQEVTLMA